MNYWLWLLTNQLYRPSCKSITPALGFGFAVDGGGGSGENILPFFRSIPKKCYCSQAGALREGTILDTSDACADRDARQAGAEIEGANCNAGDTVRDRVICTCLASRISIQRSLLFIEENSIDTRVIHVPRTDLDAR